MELETVALKLPPDVSRRQAVATRAGKAGADALGELSEMVNCQLCVKLFRLHMGHPSFAPFILEMSELSFGMVFRVMVPPIFCFSGKLWGAQGLKKKRPTTTIMAIMPITM